MQQTPCSQKLRCSHTIETPDVSPSGSGMVRSVPHNLIVPPSLDWQQRFLLMCHSTCASVLLLQQVEHYTHTTHALQYTIAPPCGA